MTSNALEVDNSVPICAKNSDCLEKDGSRLLFAASTGETTITLGWCNLLTIPFVSMLGMLAISVPAVPAFCNYSQIFQQIVFNDWWKVFLQAKCLQALHNEAPDRIPLYYEFKKYNGGAEYPIVISIQANIIHVWTTCYIRVFGTWYQVYRETGTW